MARGRLLSANSHSPNPRDLFGWQARSWNSKPGPQGAPPYPCPFSHAPFLKKESLRLCGHTIEARDQSDRGFQKDTGLPAQREEIKMAREQGIEGKERTKAFL